MLRMRDYPEEPQGRSWPRCAEEAGVRLRRGLRFRNATDGLIALRAGFDTAMLGSCNRYKLPDNYHWPTDVPDNVDFATVATRSRSATPSSAASRPAELRHPSRPGALRSAPSGPSDDHSRMSADRATFDRAWSAFAEGRLGDLAALLHPDVEWHSAPLGTVFRGRGRARPAGRRPPRGRWKSLTVVLDEVDELAPTASSRPTGRVTAFGHSGDRPTRATIACVDRVRRRPPRARPRLRLARRARAATSRRARPRAQLAA